MAKTISELRNQSIQVRDASAAGENTATRVGTVLNDIVGHIEDYENTQSSNNSSQDAKIEGVKSSLNAEIARAKTEESNLSTQIGTERTERQAAVSKEETARIQADNDEKTARQQADNAEQDARIKGDNDEKTARENADITLRTMIQTEVSNREKAVAAEAARAKAAEEAETARATAEEQRLQGEIDNTNNNLNSLDNKVNSNHDHLTDEVAKLDLTDNEIKAGLEAEKARAKGAEEANAKAIAEEKAAIMGTDRIADGAITIEKLADNAIDDEPIARSDNLIKSGGVAKKLAELEVKVSGVRYSKNTPSSTQSLILGTTTIKSGLLYNIKFNIDVVPLNELYFRFKDADGNNVPLKINGEPFTEPFNIQKGKTEAEFKNISVDVDSEVNITYLRYVDIYSGTATISAYIETGLRQEVEQLEYDQKQLKTRFDTKIGNENLVNETATYKQGDAQQGATKNTAGDIVVTTSSNLAVWQFVIGVVAGQTISINGYGAESYRLWALVGDNGNIISKSQGGLDATSTPQLVFVESDCTLIVSCYDDYISSLKVVVNTKGLAELTRQSYKMFEGIFGKKMYFVGDSIMIGRPNEEDTLNITTHIANMTGSNCVNLARGGSLFMYPWALGNQNSIYQQLTQVPSDADCVIVQGGLNGVEMTDPSKTNYAPMGEISALFDDDFNKATQIGCLEAICKYLHENFCGKKVGFIMTYQIGDYSYWKNKAEKFSEVLDKWSIPVLDWRCSGVSLASSTLSRKWGYDTQNYPQYDTSKGYAIDDCVIYNGSAYKCNVTILSPAGSFDSSKWTKITGTRYDNWHCNGVAYEKLANITAHWIATL